MITREEEIFDKLCSNIRSHSAHMAGGEGSDGLLIAVLIRIVANLYEHLIDSEPGEDDLSGPRMGLLMRLMEEERQGNTEGVTPTSFSRGQHVSRNTISALLRGLEEQGYIERTLDPKDKRLFRIKITRAGRERIKEVAPVRIAQANQLVSGLSEEEREELIRLLGKLFTSLHEHSTAS